LKTLLQEINAQKGCIMITVKCTCGKTYQVKDSYANKKAKCTCGKVLTVPEFSAEELNKPTEKISFSCCNCGKTFKVSAKFKGKKVRCKSCHTVQTVPMKSEQPDNKEDEKLPEASKQDSVIKADDKEKHVSGHDEDSKEKIETEKTTSSEKPKRLLIICLAMVLLGAIAYDLFVFNADKTDKTVPTPTKQATSTETTSEKQPESITETNIQEDAGNNATDGESVSEETQREEEKVEPQIEPVSPEPEKDEKQSNAPKKTEQPMDKQPEIHQQPEKNKQTDNESTIDNTQVKMQSDREKNENTQNMIASVDPKALKEDTKQYLRSTPMTYTKKQVIDMIQKYNFYEAQFNPNGGYPNRFVDNRNGTITDNETQLMWQKSGTREMVSWKKAPEYIDRLNNRKFSGYSNWRLPTLEELLTLTEPRHSRQGLYISSFFSQKQGIVGSSDSCNYDGKNLPWYISFLRGISNCISYNLIDEFHVRAVRSMDRPDKQLLN
jgi:hypothetical protein